LKAMPACEACHLARAGAVAGERRHAPPRASHVKYMYVYCTWYQKRETQPLTDKTKASPTQAKALSIPRLTFLLLLLLLFLLLSLPIQVHKCTCHTPTVVCRLNTARRPQPHQGLRTSLSLLHFSLFPPLLLPFSLTAYPAAIVHVCREMP